MGTGSARALALALAVLLACSDIAAVTAQETERIEGTRDDPLPLSAWMCSFPSLASDQMSTFLSVSTTRAARFL
jgi:hypothetical protein